MSKVPVQKGPIIANQKTMKSMLRTEIDAEDKANAKLRKSGQTLNMLGKKIKK